MNVSPAVQGLLNQINYIKAEIDMYQGKDDLAKAQTLEFDLRHAYQKLEDFLGQEATIAVIKADGLKALEGISKSVSAVQIAEKLTQVQLQFAAKYSTDIRKSVHMVAGDNADLGTILEVIRTQYRNLSRNRDEISRTNIAYKKLLKERIDLLKRRSQAVLIIKEVGAEGNVEDPQALAKALGAAEFLRTEGAVDPFDLNAAAPNIPARAEGEEIMAFAERVLKRIKLGDFDDITANPKLNRFHEVERVLKGAADDATVDRIAALAGVDPDDPDFNGKLEAYQRQEIIQDVLSELQKDNLNYQGVNLARAKLVLSTTKTGISNVDKVYAFAKSVDHDMPKEYRRKIVELASTVLSDPYIRVAPKPIKRIVLNKPVSAFMRKTPGASTEAQATPVTPVVHSVVSKRPSVAVQLADAAHIMEPDAGYGAFGRRHGHEPLMTPSTERSSRASSTPEGAARIPRRSAASVPESPLPSSPVGVYHDPETGEILRPVPGGGVEATGVIDQDYLEAMRQRQGHGRIGRGKPNAFIALQKRLQQSKTKRHRQFRFK